MKWKLLHLYFLLFCCIQLSSSSIQQVGVILHHDSTSVEDALTNYISKLSEPRCQFISQFNILSFNKESPEIYKLKQKANTLPIPLNFDFKTSQENGMMLRIAENSTAELYYVGDINSNDLCQKIGEYLAFAQEHEAAGIVPLVGQFQQTSVITVDNSQKVLERYFNYAKNQHLNHFQIVENIRLISRHTLQLATSSIKEVKLMAKVSPTCEQIFLNFVAAHFYPELRSRIYKFANKLPPLDSRNIPLKSVCVRAFIQILGYCPLFYQKKIFTGKIWKNPNFNQVVELKKVALNAEIQFPTENRLLMQHRQQAAQQPCFFAQFSSVQAITLSILVIILAALLLSIFLLLSKIKVLSSHRPIAMNLIRL